MNLTAATITIYFIGLVNFDTQSGYKAVVPLATGSPSFGGVTLQPHRADLVITKWPSGNDPTTGCAAIPMASWDGTSTCIVKGLVEQEVEVVSSETLAVQARFHSVPKLRGTALCPSVGTLTPNVGTAVEMAISNGKLDACLHVQAWIASLTVDVAASNNFKIGTATLKKTLTLDGGAVVNIISTPTTTPDPNPKTHFFWHYYMRNSNTGCSLLPQELNPVPPELECPSGIPALPHHQGGVVGWPVATGVGCSVTQYP